MESHERLLNLGEVEGHQALLLKALTVVRRFRSDATAKTKWLSEVPQIFSIASRPETAQEILRQARACDADAHHPLTCEFTERFEADLVKIAAGDVSNVPQDLVAEEAIMQRIPLSSQACEAGQSAHPHLRHHGLQLLRGCKRIAQLRQGQEGLRPVQNKWTDVCALGVPLAALGNDR